MQPFCGLNFFQYFKKMFQLRLYFVFCISARKPLGAHDTLISVTMFSQTILYEKNTLQLHASSKHTVFLPKQDPLLSRKRKLTQYQFSKPKQKVILAVYFNGESVSNVVYHLHLGILMNVYIKQMQLDFFKKRYAFESLTVILK